MARIAPDVIEEYKRQAEYRRVWIGRGHADNNLFNILVPEDPNRLASDEYAKINGKSTALSVAVETNRTLNAYTISDLMKKENINSIEILKIDIEGYEFHVLLPFLEKHVVCQILIEIHGKPLDVVELLKMVSLHGYLLFHYEINPVGQLTATEFSLIHESCLKRYDAIKLSKYFSENDNIGR
ncbi:hypothetical protein WR25_08403 [Diploscapter pachys]|uniref:Methyltransferase FkbM domain-containing protein n=1 Tax=Diploscapter pachys TaxID=2018661 RepID=A0A2A2KTZ8_9BILA|nr:hypothetical protein WR25_08403 [Diploscapter pachys]